MGNLKSIERSSKRALMRAMGKIIRTQKLSPEEILRRHPERILIIRQHNQMGDMVLAIPALRAVKESFPRSEVGIVTSTINRDVMLNNPYVDHLFVYEKQRVHSLPGFVMAIRRKRFDLVIVLNTVSFSFTSAVLALLSGAKIRVGSSSLPFGSEIGGSFYHLELPLPGEAELREMSETEHNLYPLRMLGISTNDLSPLLVPSLESEVWAQDFSSECWRSDQLKLVVHPGAGKKENIWAPEKFAAVVNRLNSVRPVGLVVVSGPRDAKPVAAFLQNVSVPGKVLEARSIGDVAAVMKKSDLVICNDTGTMHVACAAGARTLGVFGPTDPKRWAPRSPNLCTIQAPEKRLDLLTWEMVFEKALEALQLVSRTQYDL
ncbi:MAG: hypothetical protein GTO51_10730 [Candidatus Latescibacteria bacterium]|nr:hypothetical protein [Candidatus Latescibacterota bacterium]NIM66440.1 hypothetical protein [Candidatus Latescibacterota bacterium]NIO02920.1 hypothetical protein [Candidatus Latescibacterota bacterium]NIO30055.1 hypothetical protein [Candidatus Latescibacterota bacterium]NIO57670.1 hypothetical protein [Candidatus Latescibacterota bacterium]